MMELLIKKNVKKNMKKYNHNTFGFTVFQRGFEVVTVHLYGGLKSASNALVLNKMNKSTVLFPLWTFLLPCAQ